MKKDDKVKYISGTHGDSSSNPLWGGKYGNIEGILKQVQVDYDEYYVIWDNGRSNTYSRQDLNLVARTLAPHPYTTIFK